MTRDEHLKFCKRCTQREFNPQHGIVCGLTKKIAAFENTCPDFKVDETVKEEVVATEPVNNVEIVNALPSDVKEKLREQQDWLYACIGGLSAAIVGALLWALITVSTKYQIGYMAIGVGLLVGFSVRYFGAGIDYAFGIIGGFFALLGCALGNLLSQVVFIADAQSMGYFEVLTLLNPTVIISIFEESFSGMDIVFYGIAAYEGYKFAFRNITEDVINSVSKGILPPLPLANLRLPIIVTLAVGISAIFFFVHKSAVGVKTYLYENGAKRSEGPMNYGVETGKWDYWWENGNQQQTGFFNEGKQDSIWQFFDEDGTRYRTATFKNGILHGTWTDYHANGQISGSGLYKSGRQQGPWIFYYEDGTVSQKGNFDLDLASGEWELYYPNGRLNSKGSFLKNEYTGVWNSWYENGTKSEEREYFDSDNFNILNSWDSLGNFQVKAGNGIYKAHNSDGVLQLTGSVKDGVRSGIWKSYSSQGKLREEGEFKAGKYHIVNSWSYNGTPMVIKGEGTYENYYDEVGAVQETGKISGGLRNGEWVLLSALDSTTMQRMHYVMGKMDGEMITYFDGALIQTEGKMANNKREGEWKWYHQNGTLETSANYVNGLKEGPQNFYDEYETLIRTEFYQHGELTNVEIK